METASVIVSTNPELFPVMRILKLTCNERLMRVRDGARIVHALSNPTGTVFVLPNLFELLNELYS